MVGNFTFTHCNPSQHFCKEHLSYMQRMSKYLFAEYTCCRLQLTTAGAAGSTLGGDNVEFFLLKMVYVKESFKFGPFKIHFMKIKIEH